MLFKYPKALDLTGTTRKIRAGKKSSRPRISQPRKRTTSSLTFTNRDPR